jgi:hypothetical protein
MDERYELSFHPVGTSPSNPVVPLAKLVDAAALGAATCEGMSVQLRQGTPFI